MRGVHESIPATEDQIRKVYEAGFRAAFDDLGSRPADTVGEKEKRIYLQHAWKKFCGCDS